MIIVFIVIVEQCEILLNVKILICPRLKYYLIGFLAHFLPFLNQCWVGKYGNTPVHTHYQSEELLAGVTSYFDHNRAIHSSANDLMTCSLERTRQPLINSINTNRTVSLNLSSKSNEHSPKHHHSLSTPTNHEQSNF